MEFMIYHNDVGEFDIVLLPTPVYMGQVSEVLLNYAKNNDYSNNDVYVIITGDILDEKSEIILVIEVTNNPKSIKGIKIKSIFEEFKAFLLID